MINSVIIKEYFESVKNTNSLEELKEFCKFYERYFYLVAIKYTDDANLIEQLTQVGDDLMRDYLNYHFINRTNSEGLFDTFMHFDKSLKLNFSALEQRINEGSPILDKDIYKSLLNGYRSYEDITKKYQDLSKHFEDEIASLGFASVPKK